MWVPDPSPVEPKDGGHRAGDRHPETNTTHFPGRPRALELHSAHRQPGPWPTRRPHLGYMLTGRDVPLRGDLQGRASARGASRQRPRLHSQQQSGLRWAAPGRGPSTAPPRAAPQACPPPVAAPQPVCWFSRTTTVKGALWPAAELPDCLGGGPGTNSSGRLLEESRKNQRKTL